MNEYTKRVYDAIGQGLVEVAQISPAHGGKIVVVFVPGPAMAIWAEEIERGIRNLIDEEGAV